MIFAAGSASKAERPTMFFTLLRMYLLDNRVKRIDRPRHAYLSRFVSYLWALERFGQVVYDTPRYRCGR